MFAVIAVLFLGVTLGQILLFRGKKPRLASALVGGMVFPLSILAVALCSNDSHIFDDPPHVLVFFGIGLILATPGGAALGYLAGCVMAGVFLIQEDFRRRSYKPVAIELLPLAATDFDTLISWVHHSPLFDIWSRGRFRYPLDHEQLAAHVGRAADESYKSEAQARDGTESELQATDEVILLADPRPAGYAGVPSGFPGESQNRLCFKAVCGEMREMVGYAELANIDREKSRASIELAIVDPSRNDRDHLSETLVWEVMQHAFNGQGLHGWVFGSAATWCNRQSAFANSGSTITVPGRNLRRRTSILS